MVAVSGELVTAGCTAVRTSGSSSSTSRRLKEHFR
jgi:hypothetical protein